LTLGERILSPSDRAPIKVLKFYSDYQNWTLPSTFLCLFGIVANTEEASRDSTRAETNKKYGSFPLIAQYIMFQLRSIPSLKEHCATKSANKGDCH
jgi:hypothetical protein